MLELTNPTNIDIETALIKRGFGNANAQEIVSAIRHLMNIGFHSASLRYSRGGSVEIHWFTTDSHPVVRIY